MDHLQAIMTYVAYTLLAIYFAALLWITLYCLLQFHLLYFYRKGKKKHAKPEQPPLQEWPMVTVQLPIFNEKYVAERLIDNIVLMDYPKDRIEFQVLDDSTDETAELTRRKVAQYKNQGFQMEWIHRKDRSGFKAGALKEALPQARGAFVAIFDADFLPRPDFLRTTLPYFRDASVGVVQTRWEHINEQYSMLTRLQALQLNVHFTVEQKGRELANCFLQFNGTAGLWRKATIEDAGGWEADTLTEDLDLSYRAQLKGWKIVFLEQVGSPAELPAEMNALKSQQFRWMKGGAENARKLLPTVWRSDQLNLRQKLHATGHLMASTVFVFIFIAGIFSVPLAFLLQQIQFDPVILSIFLTGLLSVFVVYYTANIPLQLQQNTRAKALLKFLFLFPVFLALSMGLSLHNSIAVLQGYWGKPSDFIRTPKFGIQSLQDSFRQSQYRARKLPWTTLFEVLLTLYFTAAVVAALYTGNLTFLFFHLLLAFGFGSIAWYSIKHLGLK